MKKIILIVFLFIICSISSRAQLVTVFNEGFESYDSLTLPPGWSVWNAAAYPIVPFSNWCVRDTGVSLPGVAAPRVSTAHTGHKSIGVSWYSGIDTTTGNSGVSDAWLVTKRIHVYSNTAYISYYVSGGSTSLKDSLQTWISTSDSLPTHFTRHYNTVVLGPGEFGTFGIQLIQLTGYAGQDIFVGFRYNMDVTVDGIFVQIDDVKLLDVIGIRPISTNAPTEFNLRQNYPNPFNPVTNIEFSLPKSSFTTLKIYDEIGREIKTLVSENLKPGVYKVDFDASDLPSGAYFYRLDAGDYVKTNKMILVK